MKADINEKGFLTVFAESPLESYALKQWSADYFANVECQGDGEAVLRIEVVEPVTPA